MRSPGMTSPPIIQSSVLAAINLLGVYRWPILNAPGCKTGAGRRKRATCRDTGPGLATFQVTICHKRS